MSLDRHLFNAPWNDAQYETKPDWNRYMGPVTPEQYKARGGTRETLLNDLEERWGIPWIGRDYLTPQEIRDLAEQLAQLAGLEL